MVVLLYVLFNIMLKHGIVSSLFLSGIIVPVIKDKHGDTSDINNYRAITLSPSISKLFEKYLLLKFGHLFVVSPLQYGFYRAMRCISAVFAATRCPSVRLSVTFVDHVKRINISSKFFHHRVATPF